MALPVKTETKNSDKQKVQKEPKAPKPLLGRMDEQITRAVISKKVSFEELEKFEARVSRLKVLLEA